jgi:N-acetylglucosaminyldiphosphoundecaprenol N-acetyl-beta-D-mannosaminyltransferase
MAQGSASMSRPAIIEESRRRLDVLGIEVDALNLPAAVALVESWIARKQHSFAIFRDVHGVMLCRRDEKLRAAHLAAGMVATDGMPLMWLARGAFGSEVGRVYGPDFMELFCRSTAAKGYRHFFYGSTPKTVSRLVGALSAKAPGLVVAGTLSPPFRPLTREEDEEIVRTINAARPDVVWVGLSTPKQELWMLEHLGRIDAAAMLGVGAAYDFLSGNKPQAPRWIRQSGFEWAFRLITEPRRLARRYFRNLPAFVVAVAAQRLGFRAARTGAQTRSKT